VSHEVNGFLFEPGDRSSARGYIACIINSIDMFESPNHLELSCSSPSYSRYIVRLKDDSRLCTKMGAKGRACVADRSAVRVVKDLVKWYEQGAANRLARSAGAAFASVALLLWSVPFSMVCIMGYEIVVSQGIRSNIDNMMSFLTKICALLLR
jgi:hypothetical protein